MLLGRRFAAGLCAAASIAVYPLPVSASDLFYTYDVHGRLTSMCESRAVGGYRTVYQYDSADNRSNVTSIRTDQWLGVNMAIFSPDGRFQLKMQTDGNLVLYGNLGSGWVPMGWSTNTVGSGATSAYFQSDGNFVLYTSVGASPWYSNTASNRCATLAVQNDGNVVIKNMQGAVVWQTGTGGH